VQRKYSSAWLCKISLLSTSTISTADHDNIAASVVDLLDDCFDLAGDRPSLAIGDDLPCSFAEGTALLFVDDFLDILQL
jgi:hypothetical protein